MRLFFIQTSISRESDIVKDYMVPAAIVFIILISIQYSINKVIVLLKEIKEILLNKQGDNYRR